MLRKLDVLATQAITTEDPALSDIAALRDGCDRLVSLLSRRAQAEQCRTRDAVRRLR